MMNPYQNFPKATSPRRLMDPARLSQETIMVHLACWGASWLACRVCRRSRPMYQAAARTYQAARAMMISSAPGHAIPSPSVAQKEPKADSRMPTTSCRALRGMRSTSRRASAPAPPMITRAAAAARAAEPNARAAAPKVATMIATSRPSSTTPRKARRNAIQSTPWAGMSSSVAFRAPMPRRPLAATRRIPLRSHCRPNTNSSEPATSRSTLTGTRVSAVPSATMSAATTARPAPVPSRVDRQPRTAPTPTTMITISMISTAAARNVVVKTPGMIMATSLPPRSGLAPVWNRVLPLPPTGRFGGVGRDVLAHRLQLFGERGERAEARLLAEGSAGLLQRVEPFGDDLPGRVLVRQHEDGGTGDVEGRARGLARVCRTHRQRGQHRAQVAHHAVHQVLGGAGQGVDFGRGLAVVDVVPAEHLEGDLVQAVGQVGDLRGGGVLDQGPGRHVGGQPDEGRLDRPGRVESGVGGLLGQQVLQDSHEGAEV